MPASGIAFLVPVDERGSLGMWTGTMWSMCSISTIIGPPIVGALVKILGISCVGYWAGCNLLAAATLLTLAVITKGKDDRKRDIEKESYRK